VGISEWPKVGCRRASSIGSDFIQLRSQAHGHVLVNHAHVGISPTLIVGGELNQHKSGGVSHLLG